MRTNPNDSSELYDAEDDYSFDSPVNSNEFLGTGKDLDSATMDDMEAISTLLLRQSYDFCNSFVPQQLEFMRRGISVANARMHKARSADDYMKLAATSKTLYASYSQLIEQSTVVFMSSYRPLQMLITTGKNQNSTESVTPIVNDVNVEPEKLDLTTIESDYKPYIDD